MGRCPFDERPTPTADLTLLADPDKNIAVIVKDGTVVKRPHPVT
jgi:hypothetical protein